MSKNECPNCQGKFGLMRQYLGRISFCCKNCKYEYVLRQYLLVRDERMRLEREHPPDQQELPLDKPPDKDPRRYDVV